MSLLWIWIGALVLYGVFELWYGNWSGPLSPDEVKDYMARIEAGAESPDPERLATLRPVTAGRAPPVAPAAVPARRAAREN